MPARWNGIAVFRWDMADFKIVRNLAEDFGFLGAGPNYFAQAIANAKEGMKHRDLSDVEVRQIDLLRRKVACIGRLLTPDEQAFMSTL